MRSGGVWLPHGDGVGWRQVVSAVERALLRVAFAAKELDVGAFSVLFSVERHSLICAHFVVDVTLGHDTVEF